MPALAEPVKPGMAHLCPRRGEVRCLTASKRCLLDAEFPQSMQDSNRTSAPTPVLRAAHARKPRSPRKAKGRERLAKRAAAVAQPAAAVAKSRPGSTSSTSWSDIFG